MKISTPSREYDVPFCGRETVSDTVLRAGLHFLRPCGGNGVCGKCRVSVSGSLSLPDEVEKKAIGALLPGVRLACRAYVEGDDVEITLPGLSFPEKEEINPFPLPSPDPCGEGIGAAVDIGTTTIAFSFLDLKTGEKLGYMTLPNPQAFLGSDVISRIAASSRGEREKLTSLVREAVDGGIAASGFPVSRRTVVGNTVMLTLWHGDDPTPLGRWPYPVPDFYGRTEKNDFIAPCLSAFIGGDALAAALACRLPDREGDMLVDLGTNGEIVFSYGGKLFCTSCAAGPALEGGGISCGMPAVSGAAVSAVSREGRVELKTAYGEKPTGLCGSAVIDVFSYLVGSGEIPSDGGISEPVLLSDGISVTPKDVRSLQLAKSAVRSAIEILPSVAGASVDQIRHILLAGSFGASLDPRSCLAVGLLPDLPGVEIIPVGNAALRGAEEMLLSEKKRREAMLLPQRSVSIDLADWNEFEDLFVKYISFPKGESR